MSLSCIVLGGSGFVGSHLCETLLEAGHRVKVLVPKGFSLQNLEKIQKQVEIFPLDMNEAGKTDEIWGGVDRVFHLACTTRPKTANDDPARDLEENLIATVRILDRCAANQIGRIIFMSSGGTVYGKAQNLPIPEDHPLTPICSYGIHKFAIEQYLRFYKIHHGLDYRIARVANVYGERQSVYGNQGLIGTVFEKILTGQPVQVFGQGETVRDYLYVSDTVTALMLLAQASTSSSVFNIGSGLGLTVMEVIRMIEQTVKRKAVLNFLPARVLDVDKNILNISRIQNELGWTPLVSIQKGLERTAAWWRTQTHQPIS